MAQCLSEDLECKVSAKRLWLGSVKDAHHCLPKCMPEKIECVEYPEGHAAETGCVRTIKFHKALAAHFKEKHHREVLHIKEKIEEVDNELLKIKISVIEGGLLGILFNHYKYTFEFKEGPHKDTCVVHWSIEYKSIGHHHEYPDEAKEGITSTFKAVEAYLLTHNDYA